MDRSLMKQRYRGAQISLCANSDEPRVEIVPSRMVFCRETSLALLFLTMFTVTKLRNGKDTARKTDTDAGYLHAKCFSTGDIYDVSSTIFADDITKRTVTNTPQEVITKMGETSTMFKKFAADIGIVMNQCKEEHQVGFCGSWFGHVGANVAQR